MAILGERVEIGREEIALMSLNRRQFLLFFGATAGTAALGSFANGKSGGLGWQAQPGAAQTLAFQPVKSPMPYPTLGMSPEQQMAEFSTFAVVDDLVLPEGYTYDVIGAWGDAVGDSRFGYNNDYLSYVETTPGQGYLGINFEYISPETWSATFKDVIGKDLPLAEIMPLLAAAGDEGVNIYAMADSDPMKAKFVELCEAGLTDVGIGVVSIQQGADGAWSRTNSVADRRITGMSGLKDGRYLKATGPAVAVFKKTSGQGYIDGLDDQIIGTFNNCAGGTTPWGTLVSAEENFQDTVIEPVYADGTAMDPGMQSFSLGDLAFGSALGYAGNKYGWMVEVDPANPDDYGVKHSWLGVTATRPWRCGPWRGASWRSIPAAIAGAVTSINLSAAAPCSIPKPRATPA
jgi:secreted PhoX family phosphatase